MSRPLGLEGAGPGGDLERGLGPDHAHPLGDPHVELLSGWSAQSSAGPLAAETDPWRQIPAAVGRDRGQGTRIPVRISRSRGSWATERGRDAGRAGKRPRSAGRPRTPVDRCLGVALLPWRGNLARIQASPLDSSRPAGI